MKLGVVFRESFRGSYHTLREPLVERAAELHLVVQLDAWGRLLREGVARIEGTVSLEGLADRAALGGDAWFRIRREKRVAYDLAFKSDDARSMHLRGQREPHPASPLEVVTNLRFSLYDETDAEMGRGLVRCDVRSDLRRALGSLRVRLAG